jgi:hypothetical protein
LWRSLTSSSPCCTLYRLKSYLSWSICLACFLTCRHSYEGLFLLFFMSMLFFWYKVEAALVKSTAYTKVRYTSQATNLPAISPKVLPTTTHSLTYSLTHSLR